MAQSHHAASLPMNSSYWYSPRKGIVVRIGLNNSGWVVWLNGQLICDGFGRAEEAAYCAHRKDFADESAIALFSRVYVPGELSGWNLGTPPKEANAPSREVAVKDCKNRLWKPGPRLLA